MFSKSCEYGIKAVIYIAQQSNEHNPVNVAQVSKNIKAPEFFIAKILQDLTRKKILNSIKCPRGGFYSTKSQKDIQIIDIVKIIDGDQLFTKCVLGLDNCSSLNPCPMHKEYQHIRKSIIDMLSSNTVEDFYKLLNKNKAVLI